MSDLHSSIRSRERRERTSSQVSQVLAEVHVSGTKPGEGTLTYSSDEVFDFRELNKVPLTKGSQYCCLPARRYDP